ncbi:MAG: hypothetical protein CMJ72_15275 [Planctomycetaceae bacterium]|nr:hypothetical protein [Planctomycetaceae bacterium]
MCEIALLSKLLLYESVISQPVAPASHLVLGVHARQVHIVHEGKSMVAQTQARAPSSSKQAGEKDEQQ